MSYEFIADICPEKRVVGTKQVLRGIDEGTLRCVVVASDADNFISERVMAEAKARNVAVIMCPSKLELGRLVGVKIGAATVGVLNEEAK